MMMNCSWRARVHTPYLRADVTNGSPRDFVSLLNSKRINSVVGFSLCNRKSICVKASAWFDDSNSGKIFCN